MYAKYCKPVKVCIVRTDLRASCFLCFPHRNTRRIGRLQLLARGLRRRGRRKRNRLQSSEQTLILYHFFSIYIHFQLHFIKYMYRVQSVLCAVYWAWHFVTWSTGLRRIHLMTNVMMVGVGIPLRRTSQVREFPLVILFSISSCTNTISCSCTVWSLYITIVLRLYNKLLHVHVHVAWKCEKKCQKIYWSMQSW